MPGDIGVVEVDETAVVPMEDGFLQCLMRLYENLPVGPVRIADVYSR
jgi:hypothetical protein